MHETVTFTHPKIPALTLTITRPREEAWSAAWDVIASKRNKEAAMLEAGYNLLVATARGIARAELSRLIDDWPALTTLAIGSGAELGGAFRLAGASPDDEDSAWRFDLAAALAAGKELAELRAEPESSSVAALVADRIDEILAEHGATLEALKASGISIETLADIAARYSRPGQLIAVRTRDHGLLFARRPGFQASLAFTNDSADLGHYEAAKRLVLACIVHPTSASIAARLTEYPALTTSIATLIRGETQWGLGATVKKE